MKRSVWGIMLVVTGAASAFITRKILEKNVYKEHQTAEKHFAMIKVFNRWMHNKQEQKEISKFLEERGYHSVAIYGMSFLGECLLDELQGTDINVKYAIDRNAENIHSKIDVKKLTDDLPETDVIVVTAIYFYEEIREELSQLVDCPIISLEDVVYEI